MAAKRSPRTDEIVKVSWRGIFANLLLSAFKAAAGLVANSISVVLDAVNNLSDAMSSVITIIGTKLAGKAADRKHPYGHGRIEYITASIISIIVLLAGITSLRESVDKILHPEETNYSAVTLIVLIASIGAKLLLGQYFKKKGKELHSGSLTASGEDALMDSVISFAALIGAVLNLTLGWKLEGILGALISVFIIKAGIELLRETVDHIIGSRAESELTDNIKERLNAYPEIHGAYDLILHSYGPEEWFGSVHVELDDNMTVREMDALTRRIVPQIYMEFGVILTVGVYAENTSDESAKAIKQAAKALTEEYPQIMQMHGFYADTGTKAVSFDIILSFEEQDPVSTVNALRERLSAEYPDYQFHINVDRDFSESQDE
ncbi:MAG: cation transporter [Oscillospiraceae bacterium]|nr:cation transporter [Oscillospiraceae bacterium]